eukprot:1822764-Prymnesium_polylepis.2
MLAKKGVSTICFSIAAGVSPSRHSRGRYVFLKLGAFISCAKTPVGSSGLTLSMACTKASPANRRISRSCLPPSFSPDRPPERVPIELFAGGGCVGAASANSC